MTGVALAVTTPDYQWYAILLVMLVVLDGRPEWLAFAAGGYLAAEPHLGRWRVIHHSQAVGYGLAALFVALIWVVRLVIARYPRMVFAEAASAPPANAVAPAGDKLVGAMTTAGAPADTAHGNGNGNGNGNGTQSPDPGTSGQEMSGAGTPIKTAAPAGESAATALVARVVLPQRKRAPSVAADGDERAASARRSHEIIPTAARR